MRIFKSFAVIMLITITAIISGCGSIESNKYFYVYKTEQPKSTIAPKGAIVGFTNLKFNYCDEEIPPIIELTIYRTGTGWRESERAINQILLIAHPSQTISKPWQVNILAAEVNLGEGIVTFLPQENCGEIEITIAGVMANDTSPYAGNRVGLTVIGVRVNYGNTEVDVDLPIIGTTQTVDASLDW